MKTEIKNMIKLIFIQMCIISFGIVLGNAVVSLIAYLCGTVYTYSWLFPIAVVTTGFVTASLTLILYIPKLNYYVRIAIHFICLVGTVTLAAYLFNWGVAFPEILLIYGILIVIYIVVWVVSLAIQKRDEIVINEKLKNNVDED